MCLCVIGTEMHVMSYTLVSEVQGGLASLWSHAECWMYEGQHCFWFEQLVMQQACSYSKVMPRQ